MNRTPYARKKRQLKNLAAKLNELHNSEGNHQSQMDLLIIRIKALIDEIRHFLNRFELKKILGAAALLIGLSFGNQIQAQNFAAGQTNPFGLVPTNYMAIPTLVDIDDDGDLDLLVGEYYGAIQFYLNTGTATNPQFAAPLVSPWNLDSVDYLAFTEFADFDNDGDFDLLIGEYYGKMMYYQNLGTAMAPVFAAPQQNPFGLVSTYQWAFPSSGDLDNDGDIDLLVGEYYGAKQYFQNTGTASSPMFAAPVSNAFGLVTTNDLAFPELVDLDDDGDLDVLVGEYYGSIKYFENIGSATNPQFAAPLSNPFGLSVTSDIVIPTSGDMDGDGDVDIIMGTQSYNGSTYLGNFVYFENLETSVGVNESIDKVEVKVFPNPVAEVLTIETNEPIEAVEIINILGELVNRYEDVQNQIDLSDLKTAIYQVKIIFSDGNFEMKKIHKK